MKYLILFLISFNLFAQTSIPERATLQMVKIKIVTNGSGYGSVDLKIPGTAGKKGARVIEGGCGWFVNQHADDYIKISLPDNDNILGQGSGYMAGTFYDSAVPSINQGWYIPIHSKKLDITALANLTHLVGGLYLRIEVFKGDNSVDTFRANLKWGVQE